MPLMTTRRTLKRHLQSLNIQDLPLMFRDAIIITRLLGIRYLWIDALCIIQDDHHDWGNQASEMGSIYQHSLVTIAVHSAKNPLEGFLWRRAVPAVLDISPRRCGNGAQPAFCLTIPPLSDHAISTSFLEGKLAKRAWVVQELCVSQRVLHFVEDRLFWDCLHKDDSFLYLENALAEIFRNRDLQPSIDWLRFIEGYSSCQMTKEGDKLPAIAGIAKLWPRASSYFHYGGYYCGIFNDDVHNSLLWLRKGRDLIRKADRAPTWSWASVDGEISFIQTCHPGNASLIPDMEVIAFECGCGSHSNSHFICKSCSIRLKAVAVDGLELGFPEKSKRFYFAPVSGPRRLFSLLSESRCVGWAVFDGYARDHPNFRYIRISAVSVNCRTTGICVLIVRPCPKRIGLQVRAGMGYIFYTKVFDKLSHEIITIA
jgi:Heterokaryon incompatibility protein (HET)